MNKGVNEPSRLLLAALALLHVLRGTDFQVTAKTPWPPRIQRTSFSWQASLDRSTGVARSLERSAFRPRCEGERRGCTAEEMDAWVLRQFARYPRFLPQVTLGLCRVRETADGCVLRAAVPPLELLAFGAPRIMSSRGAKKEMQVGDGDKLLCCVEIPIVGGLLARAAPSGNERGCLRFAWVATPGPGVALVTAIDRGYRPALAGRAVPVPAWRAAAYCATQRVVHAYVMRRFHGHVAREYNHIDEGQWRSQYNARVRKLRKKFEGQELTV